MGGNECWLCLEQVLCNHQLLFQVLNSDEEYTVRLFLNISKMEEDRQYHFVAAVHNVPQCQSSTAQTCFQLLPELQRRSFPLVLASFPLSSSWTWKPP